MRGQTIRLVMAFGAVMACVVFLEAQGGLQWVAAANGVVPDGAVPYGRDAEGRPQYVCRGPLDGGTHLGRIAAGLPGCSIAYRRSVMTIPSYEVLTEPTRAVAVRPDAGILRNRAALEAATRIGQPPALPGAVPPTPPDSSVKRGFDDRGQPYIEVRLPDGTIKRTQDNGVTLIKPDGTRQFIPPSVIRSNAPPPTPPPLPSDPRQGRAWVERHNEDLLTLISNLVRRDETEMKKFTDGERDAAGDDLFRQIAYRTKIADFLALDR